jgi:hypothetical protein
MTPSQWLGVAKTKGVPCIVAQEDPALVARVIRRIPLRYRDGADASLDRPAHVRSASGICWLGHELAVIQDDAAFLALVDPSTFAVRALTLPPGSDGLRQFDDGRGNKAFKLDLEACLVTRIDGEEVLVAFGSGSKKRMRDRMVIVNPHRNTVHVHEAPRFYKALRRLDAFSGSELNVEGAVLRDGILRLFNRGNGKPDDDQPAVDATIDVEWSALLRFLADPDEAPVPEMAQVTQYDLGKLDGWRLTFTDACVAGDRVLYTATAEDSPDATQDGPVAGSALGIIEPSGATRYAVLRDDGGEILRAKVEGVAISRRDDHTVHLVVDVDAPDAPSELLIVECSPAFGIAPRME